jgi:hypothetical protein
MIKRRENKSSLRSKAKGRKMDGWIAEWLDCWMAGLLDCWMSGLLDEWIGG